MKYLAFGVILTLASSPSLMAQQDMKLLTVETAPYVTKGTDGSFTGLFYNRVKCVLDKIHQPFAAKINPWMRAQAEVEKGRADGFFPASHSARRDQYATLTDTVMAIEFYFYSLKAADLKPDNPLFREKSKVSALWGSKRYQELVDAEYAMGPEAHTFENLFELLEHGRVDAILMSDVMAQAIIENRDAGKKYERYFHSSSKLGVYIANEFLARHPTFLKGFNTQIKNCS